MPHSRGWKLRPSGWGGFTPDLILGPVRHGVKPASQATGQSAGKRQEVKKSPFGRTCPHPFALPIPKLSACQAIVNLVSGYCQLFATTPKHNFLDKDKIIAVLAGIIVFAIGVGLGALGAYHFTVRVLNEKQQAMIQKQQEQLQRESGSRRPPLAEISEFLVSAPHGLIGSHPADRSTYF